MVNTSIELTEADIQDLSPIVVDFVCRYGSCHKEMDLLAKRFGIPLEETYVQSSASINSRAYAMISYLNGKPQLLETINFILQKGFGPKHPDLEVYTGILAKYGFTITVDGETHILSPIPSGLLEPERKTAVSWIEKNANPQVLGHLKDAKNSLGKGRFDYV